MAHFAQLDENNKVIAVIVVGDEFADNYAEWRATFGEKYVQTSYNTYLGQHRNGGIPLRKNYAVVDGTYDEVRDAFIPIKQYPSWVLDEETCDWVPPIPQPLEPGRWAWHEEQQEWININPAGS
jgi:hypothetical protein